MLLKKDKDQRISYEQIPYHPFFEGIDFDMILALKVESPLKKLINNTKIDGKDMFLVSNTKTSKKEKINQTVIDQGIYFSKSLVLFKEF